MDEWEDDDIEFVSAPSRRMDGIDFAVLGIDVVRGIFNAVTSTLQMAESIVASHANFKVNQREFATQAALEIESLTGDIEHG